MANHLFLGNYIEGRLQLMTYSAQTDPKSTFVVGLGLPGDLRKVAFLKGNKLWSGVQSIANDLEKINRAPLTLLVCHPTHDEQAVGERVRAAATFYVAKFIAKDNSEVKSKVTVSDLSYIDNAVHNDNFSNFQPLSFDPMTNVSVPKAKQLVQVMASKQAHRRRVAKTASTTEQFKTLYGEFPMPSVRLPEADLEYDIKRRVLAFVNAKSDHYHDYSSNDFHQAWGSMWEQFDLRCAALHFKTRLKQDQANGFDGSILDYAVAQNILPYVYAFVMEVCKDDNTLPAKVADLDPVELTPLKLLNPPYQAEKEIVSKDILSTVYSKEPVAMSSMK